MSRVVPCCAPVHQHSFLFCVCLTQALSSNFSFSAMFPTLLMLSGEAPLLDFTPAGQVIVSLLSIFSLVIMATATGILASGFESAMREAKEKDQTLEHTRRVLRRHLKKEARIQKKEKRIQKKEARIQRGMEAQTAREAASSSPSRGDTITISSSSSSSSSSSEDLSSEEDEEQQEVIRREMSGRQRRRTSHILRSVSSFKFRSDAETKAVEL